MPGFISMALAFVAMIGVAYTLAATALAGRWRPQGAAQAPAGAPSITMLKPLHGPEPMLEAKLRGFLDQDYPAPVDMVDIFREAQYAPDIARETVAERTGWA